MGSPVMSAEDAVSSLDARLIGGWNGRDAKAMAAPLAPDGLVIGFDGSQMSVEAVSVSARQ